MVTQETKARIKHTLWEETKKMLWLALYLFAFLAALASYRAVLLGKGGAGASPLLHCAIEALVLAKVMLIGDALKIGERHFQSRMILRTVSRALAFTLFALLFSASEELVVGLYHGKAFGELWQELLTVSPRILLARAMVLFIFLIPLVALWELSRMLGDGKLFQFFFALSDAPHRAHSKGNP